MFRSNALVRVAGTGRPSPSNSCSHLLTVQHWYRARPNADLPLLQAAISNWIHLSLRPNSLPGSSDCQARDVQKLAFHFNASLTALNLAKLEALQQHSGQEPFVFSLASIKRRMRGQHLLDQFIRNLDLEPSQIKSHPNYSSLCNYGVIAA